MNKKTKVYIAGPMTGYINLNKDAFEGAERLLIAAGYSVFNPWRVSEILDESWDVEECYSIDIAALKTCDAIYMLDGWEESLGATNEYLCAIKAEMPVLTFSSVVYGIWEGINHEKMA